VRHSAGEDQGEKRREGMKIRPRREDQGVRQADQSGALFWIAVCVFAGAFLGLIGFAGLLMAVGAR
jgi:hypothetical protein